MDLRTLELFRHLAGSLHFGRTSRACHITPSALTRLIQRLEAQVGQPLFVRDNRSVDLTRAGRILKQYAEDVTARWDRLQAELSRDEVLHGELSIYCSVTAAYSILPDIINSYRTAHPGVNIRLETGDPARSLARLVNRDADVVIAAMPEKLQNQMTFLLMRKSPLVFIAPQKRHHIISYKGGEIDWEKTPMVLADTGRSREHMDAWFARNQKVPRIYSRVAGHEAIIALVNLGCGIGLVPRIVLEQSPLADRIRILANVPSLPPYKIGLCTIQRNMADSKVRALWEICAGSNV